MLTLILSWTSSAYFHDLTEVIPNFICSILSVPSYRFFQYYHRIENVSEPAVTKVISILVSRVGCWCFNTRIVLIIDTQHAQLKQALSEAQVRKREVALLCSEVEPIKKNLNCYIIICLAILWSMDRLGRNSNTLISSLQKFLMISHVSSRQY